jgi:hypothetical protein
MYPSATAAFHARFKYALGWMPLGFAVSRASSASRRSSSCRRPGRGGRVPSGCCLGENAPAHWEKNAEIEKQRAEEG